MPMHRQPHIRSTVGANIARLRAQAGLSQLDLANAIGMDPMGVSRWERGKVMPRPETVDRIAYVLGVEVGALYLQEAA